MERLPYSALRLSAVSADDIQQNDLLLKKSREDLHETILLIPGSSGNEKMLRDFLYVCL